MRGCHFTAPTTGSLISRYGVRLGRVTRVPRLHAGIDLHGDEVYVAADGVIEVLGSDEMRGHYDVARRRFVGGGRLAGYGNCVVVRHADGVRSFYAHMASLRTGLYVGLASRAGLVLGGVGNTSNGKFDGSPSSASPGRPMLAHLHFELRRRPDGSAPFPGPYGALNLDPTPYLAERGISWSRATGALTIDPARGACSPQDVRH
jgi:murein DD-endopeptidase MepM/ murein hydrolase activator NlpD